MKNNSYLLANNTKNVEIIEVQSTPVGGTSDYRNRVINMFSEFTSESVNAIMEKLLKWEEEEIESLTENTYDLGKAVNEDILVERSIVRLDKQAKKNKAYKMAIFQIAKENNDRDFKKLMTIWKLERFLEGKLEKRYSAKAEQLAKKSLKKAKNTKSKAVQKATKKANLLLNNK